MGFTMRCYKNSDRARQWRAWLAGALLCAALPVRADFGLTLVDSNVVGDSLRFSAVVDAKLAPPVIEALNKGIPLEVAVDVIMEEHRRIWWDPELNTWELRRRIEYHPLSKQYLVHGVGIAADAFATLETALKHLGTWRDIKLLVPTRLHAKGDYRLRLRARLDIEALPAPMRPLAYASSAWRASSGWKKWKVGV